MRTGAAVNLSKRLFVLDDGEVIPIASLHDADNEIVDDSEFATEFVAGPDRDGRWWRDCIDSYGGTVH